jgi:GNAT superfamily N-acetyltransferase
MSRRRESPEPYEVSRGEYMVSDDPARLDHPAIHALIATTFWGVGMDAELLRRSVENSHSFGLYRGGRQVGFARVVTDYARNAHLADVVIADEERGRGLGKWLVAAVLDHPALRQVRTWQLSTTDAHHLYRPFGFTETPPGQVMRRSLDPAPWMIAPIAASAPPAPPEAPPEEMGGESACQMHRFYDLEDE